MHDLQEAFTAKEIIPYEDILNDEITENSFTVGLRSVINETASEIYTDPERFFRLTEVTKNLKGIITNVLLRVTQGKERPLLVLDTTFGGGKTHSLVMLYRLFHDRQIAIEIPEVR